MDVFLQFKKYDAGSGGPLPDSSRAPYDADPIVVAAPAIRCFDGIPLSRRGSLGMRHDGWPIIRAISRHYLLILLYNFRRQQALQGACSEPICLAIDASPMAAAPSRLPEVAGTGRITKQMAGEKCPRP
jgi:hypothetical protein